LGIGDAGAESMWATCATCGRGQRVPANGRDGVTSEGRAWPMRGRGGGFVKAFDVATIPRGIGGGVQD
jgi:hypothetical protein